MTIKFGAFPLKWMLIISSCLLSQLAEVSSVSLLLSTFELTESKATLQEDGSVCHFHFLYCHFVSSGDAKVYLFVFASSRGYGHWCVPFRRRLAAYSRLHADDEIPSGTCLNGTYNCRLLIANRLARPLIGRENDPTVSGGTVKHVHSTRLRCHREKAHTKLPGYKHAHSCEDSLQGLLHHESDCKTTN